MANGALPATPISWPLSDNRPSAIRFGKVVFLEQP